MRIGTVLRDLHHDELDLARALERLAEDHRADHEVNHVARDLAEWSARHVREIAAIAGSFGEELDPAPDRPAALLDAARRAISEATGRSAAMELVLVRDLRTVYLQASGVLTDWEMIGQAAQAIMDADLLELATRCSAETKRQAGWANAKIKECSTQALVV
jgi:hypothetical protein